MKEDYLEDKLENKRKYFNFSQTNIGTIVREAENSPRELMDQIVTVPQKTNSQYNQE